MWIFNVLLDFCWQWLIVDYYFLVVQVKQYGMDFFFVGGNDINKGDGVDYYYVLLVVYGCYLMIEVKIVN